MVKWDAVLVVTRRKRRSKGKKRHSSVTLVLRIILIWSRYTFHKKQKANRLDSHDPMTPCRPSRRRLTNKQEHDITLPHAKWLPLRFSAAGRGSFDKIKSCWQRAGSAVHGGLHLGRNLRRGGDRPTYLGYHTMHTYLLSALRARSLSVCGPQWSQKF